MKNKYDYENEYELRSLRNENELLSKMVESLKKEAKIEYVNKKYDPEEIKKEVQKSIQESTEAAEKANADEKK